MNTQYSIIGSGPVGRTLAGLFTRGGIDVQLANSRGPESLAAIAAELGRHVVPVTLERALDADVVFLAVGFMQVQSVAMKRPDWAGKIVVDVTNALQPAEVRETQLRGLLSSEINAGFVSGAKLVKAFNHLPVQQLGTNPSLSGQRQVVFVASDDAGASTAIAALATRLGFAPVELGRLDQGGAAVHVLDGKRGGLLFQNLVKLG
ncbi:MAG TPA: NAD(P)-binding domain-containing protein [Burkholderiaceae bacterium]|nr:NAD(P)-binding domain-containing protein [Burkholderiaceae bacterium]